MQIYIPSKSSKIDLRCAKGSIPSVNVWKVLVHLFLSRLLTSKTVHSSLPHIQVLLIQSGCVFLLMSPNLTHSHFLYIKKSLCHPTHLHAHTLHWALLQVLTIQQWPWVLSFHAGKAVGWQSYWQLTREVSRWEHEEIPEIPPSRQQFVCTPRGYPSFGLLEESVMALERLHETRWGGQGSALTGDEPHLQAAPFHPFSCQWVLPLPLPWGASPGALTALTDPWTPRQVWRWRKSKFPHCTWMLCHLYYEHFQILRRIEIILGNIHIPTIESTRNMWLCWLYHIYIHVLSPQSILQFTFFFLWCISK